MKQTKNLSGYGIESSELAFIRNWAGSLGNAEHIPREGLCGPELLPVDFVFGTETMREFLVRCGLERREEGGTAAFTSSDPKTGFTLEFSRKVYDDFPVCERRLAFRNQGTEPTPFLHGVKSLKLSLPPSSGNEGTKLLRGRGAFHVHPPTGDSFKESFLPVLDELGEGVKIEFGPKDGRPSEDWLPFFNVKLPSNGGFVFAIGWAGHWDAVVSNGAIEVGLDHLHARLLPGERISLPSIYMLRYEGDELLRGNNILRRFIREKIAPRHNEKPIVPPVCSMAWGGISEAEHLKRIANLERKRLPVDVYWIDAGWYAPPSDNEHDPEWHRHVGNWSFNPDIFPNGLKPVSEAAHKAGMKLLLWVEPERAISGTKLPTEHPDWFLGERIEGANLLLDLGNKEARDWCVDYVSRLIERQGVDAYREDFNIDPLSLWRANDAPDRQGITEIKAVEGLYHFWGELRRRFPRLLIDNCSSGGRRIEIELLRHSVPLWSSDMQCFPGFNPDFAQTHVSGLSHWIPLFGFGTQNHEGGDTYNFRSNMGAGISVQLFYSRFLEVSESYPYEWLRARLEEFHAVKECLSGDYYPLIAEIALSSKLWSASQFDRPDAGCGALFAFRREDSSVASAEMCLKNLLPDGVYEIRDFDSGETSTAKGSELMGKGIRVEMPQPRSSRLFSYRLK